MTKREFSKGGLFLIALIPLAALFVILGFSIIKWGLDPHIPLLLSAFVAALVAIFILGYSWDELQKGISESIGIALPAILILMIIGIVIGSWIISGTVPGLIYYGLDIINPKFFLVSGLFLTAIISIATGSSWTAAGTIGIALIGIATALDFHIGWTAGAVVSGAYFGDKMSPLSDTTNLAPAVAGTDIFKHIRSMLYTTLPAFIVAAIVYTVVGFNLSSNGSVDLSQVSATKEVLSMGFNIGLWVFIPPVLVITMILLKVPALPALFVSALIGVAIAIPANGIGMDEAMDVMHYGYSSDAATMLVDDGYEMVETGEVNDDGDELFNYEKGGEIIDSSVVSNVDELLSRGGLDSMLWTVSLIICAMIFGGIMEAAGLLQAVVDMILKLVFGYTSLVVASLATSAFVNVVAADQYLAIVLPGKMYKKSFTEDYNVEPYCFSRVLESGGTLTSPLVPWNTCGATMSGFLGVPVWGAGGYAIYAIFNLVNVLFEVIAAAVGFGVVYKDDKEKIKEVMK
ncbi:MAG: Na+/H+ antiporter NhaC [Bacilli bacterium]